MALNWIHKLVDGKLWAQDTLDHISHFSPFVVGWEDWAGVRFTRHFFVISSTVIK
jgi:hypothetical protein